MVEKNVKGSAIISKQTILIERERKK